MVDQPADEKPSWIGKRLEDMTDSEREKYEKSRIDRFTWQPGDLIYLGNETLTEAEKKFVEDIKKMETEEKAPLKKTKRFSYIKGPKGIFYYDHQSGEINLISERDILISNFQMLMNMKEFIGKDGKVHSIIEEPLLFLESLPRLFGPMEDIKASDTLPKRIYYHKTKIGTFTFDCQTKHLDLLTDSKMQQENFDSKMHVNAFFDPKTRTTIKISENPKKFFLEYLPRVYGIKGEPKITDNLNFLISLKV